MMEQLFHTNLDVISIKDHYAPLVQKLEKDYFRNLPREKKRKIESMMLLQKVEDAVDQDSMHAQFMN